MKSKTRPNWEIVMRSLDLGFSVTLDDFVYKMVDGRLCHEFRIWRNGKNPFDHPDDYELQYRESDISLNYFIKACEKLPEDEIIAFGFQNALVKSWPKNKGRASGFMPFRYDRVDDKTPL